MILSNFGKNIGYFVENQFNGNIYYALIAAL
jgi:hypothetical protein